MSETANDRTQREFARVETSIRAYLCVIHEADLAVATDAVLKHRTVWEPRDAASLRDLAQTSSQDNGVLARALLEVSNRLMRLELSLQAPPEGAMCGRVTSLSGSGGLFEFDTPLDEEPHYELSLQPDRHGVPPLRCIVKLVTRSEHEGKFQHGFSFITMNERDLALLIRYTFARQRSHIRNR